MDIKQLIQTLQHTHQLQLEQMQTLLTAAFSDAVIRTELAQTAQQTAQAVFGNKIYIRGLIEFTNYCRNDCYYCGIRRSNTEAVRYRLTRLILTVPLRFPLANAAVNPISFGKKQEQIVICCAMKQQTANIMHDCTRQNSN